MTTASKKHVKTGRLDAKKERYQQRMDLIKKAQAKRKTIYNPAFGKAIDRLKFNNVAIERWRLAADSYNYQVVTHPTAKDYEQAQKLGYTPVRYNTKAGQVMFRKGTTPEGWKVLRVYDDPSTGLNAVLYQSTFEEGGKPVLAFAGTETNRIGGAWMKVPKDGAVDYYQAHMDFIRKDSRLPRLKDVDPQYAQAIVLGQQVANQYGRGITVTGHSLGGGLASAISVVSKVKGFTFNAAGLHPDTVLPYGTTENDVKSRAGNIEAIHTSGDQLTWVQRQAHPNNDVRVYQAYKSNGADVPLAIGNQRTVGTGPHGPGGTGIEEEFEKQKAHDTAQLRLFLSAPDPNQQQPLKPGLDFPIPPDIREIIPPNLSL